MPAAGATVGTNAAAGGGGAKNLSKTVVRLASIDQELKRQGSLDATPKIPWIRTERADLFFGLAIFLNTAFIGVDVEVSTGNELGFPNGLWVCESIFLVIFVVEIILRLCAEWPKMRKYFDAWGCFDFTVTVLGCIDAWIVTPIYAGQGNSADNPLSSFTVLRVFRLIRLVRLIRVLRMFSELVVLVQTIGNSIKAVAWMSLLLGMIMYTGSVLTVLMLGQPYGPEDEDIRTHFGSLGSALFSHFCVVTLEGWPDIATSAIKVHGLWALYFVFLIILTNFALVNLMVGVIVERIINFSVEHENALDSFVAESDQFKQTLQTLFNYCLQDSQGEVTREEVRKLLEDPRTHDIFTAVGINPNIPPHTLHTIMDLHRDGPTSFQEFFDACLRLCGSKHNIHSIFVQHDICDCQMSLMERFKTLEEYMHSLGGQVRPSAEQSSLPAPQQPRSMLPSSSSNQNNAPAGAVAQGHEAMPQGTEAAVYELLERMDRFGQVQQQISAEMYALQEIVAGRNGSQNASVPSRTSQTQLLDKSGQEVGDLCWGGVDSLFSFRSSTEKPPAPRRSQPTAGAHDPSLKVKVRRELEAEFRTKQAAARSPRT